MKKYPRFGKFLLVGSFNTILDISLFFILANFLGLHPIAANVISTGITMCFSYYINYTYVFTSQKRKRDTMVHFFAVTLFNAWAIQSSVIYVVVHILQNMPFFTAHVWTMNLLAKICSVGTAFMLNYLGYKYIFTEKKDIESNESR